MISFCVACKWSILITRITGNPGLGTMELTLLDFGCDAPPPTFLPPDKWEDILAISVLPGPLDSLCIQMAEMPEKWEEWYQSSEPERLALPLRPATGEGLQKYLHKHFIFYL